MNGGEIVAKRHVEAAYLQICKQYSDMLAELADFQKEMANNMLPPEAFENFEKTLQPIKNNKAKWDYFMYLLNMPNRKAKQKNYHKAHAAQIRQFDNKASFDRTLKENEEVLKELRKAKESL
jgi:hypothetical protein